MEASMNFDVDEAIVNSATRCDKQKACLTNEDHVYCRVEHCLMHRVHFVTCLHDEPCPYKNTVDHHTICSCPVRTEIFRRYGE
jgi:hypothetical protein